jgi:RNA polymerase sigma-70 factor (ECF subfamily)
MVSAQAGDAVAYEKLLREVLSYTQRKVRFSVADASAREDVVQNVLIAIHRSRHTFRPERSFAPWLHTLIRHAVVDWLRARGRRLRHEVSLELDAISKLTTENEREPTRQLSPELEQALADLPATQRDAVRMIHLEGLTVIEAAARAGVTPGALKVRAHRGYRALRARLGSISR